jgi:hypothetical protein
MSQEITSTYNKIGLEANERFDIRDLLRASRGEVQI